MIAALLVGGELKLKVSGNEVTVNGSKALEGLKNNNTFKNIGISLRYEKLSNDILDRASSRLTELIGDEQVLPLEDEISKVAVKNLNKYTNRLSPLATKLDNLKLPGASKISYITKEIEDLLSSDASDAPNKFGREI